MSRTQEPSLNRREFLAVSSAGAAIASLSLKGSKASAAGQKLRVAIVGTGSRGSYTWGKTVVEQHGDVVEIVGLCDINRKRVAAAQKIIGTSAPTFVDFEKMVKQTRPEAVIVTTVDSTHYKYIVQALELGCDAITEKLELAYKERRRKHRL